MASTTLKAYSAAAASALTTEFNSLANGSATAASSAIDNSSTLDLYLDLELNVAAQGSSRSAGATITVFILRSLDGGSTYPDANTTTAEVAAVFPLDAATTARVAVRTDIPLSPGLFKLFALNSTGQALAASSTTLRYRTHSITTA